MREIKFRAWDGKKFIYSNSIKGVERLGWFFSNTKGMTKYQFTGLKDQSDADIYEGNIVRVLFTDWPSQSITDERSLDEYKESLSHMFTVEFNDAEFCLSCPSHYCESVSDYRSIWCGKHGYIEIIGNIHQNPELLCAKK